MGIPWMKDKRLPIFTQEAKHVYPATSATRATIKLLSELRSRLVHGFYYSEKESLSFPLFSKHKFWKHFLKRGKKMDDDLDGGGTNNDGGGGDNDGGGGDDDDDDEDEDDEEEA
ncbi:hypothetical protein LguiB_008791 [Lonicera macranthoides]